MDTTLLKDVKVILKVNNVTNKYYKIYKDTKSIKEFYTDELLPTDFTDDLIDYIDFITVNTSRTLPLALSSDITFDGYTVYETTSEAKAAWGVTSFNKTDKNSDFYINLNTKAYSYLNEIPSNEEITVLLYKEGLEPYQGDITVSLSETHNTDVTVTIPVFNNFNEQYSFKYIINDYTSPLIPVTETNGSINFTIHPNLLKLGSNTIIVTTVIANDSNRIVVNSYSNVIKLINNAPIAIASVNLGIVSIAISDEDLDIVNTKYVVKDMTNHIIYTSDEITDNNFDIDTNVIPNLVYGKDYKVELSMTDGLTSLTEVYKFTKRYLGMIIENEDGEPLNDGKTTVNKESLFEPINAGLKSEIKRFTFKNYANNAISLLKITPVSDKEGLSLLVGKTRDSLTNEITFENIGSEGAATFFMQVNTEIFLESGTFSDLKLQIYSEII